jgi:hypothetical protein
LLIAWAKVPYLLLARGAKVAKHQQSEGISYYHAVHSLPSNQLKDIHIFNNPINYLPKHEI